jgi:hypothetical protein
MSICHQRPQDTPILGVSVCQFTGRIEGDHIVLAMVPKTEQQSTVAADFTVRS